MPDTKPRVVTLCAALLLALPPVASAQRPDSVPELRPIAVRVTRIPEQLGTLGSSVTVVDSSALRRGRLGGGLDEALAFVPGLIASNRWNPSLDQRIVIRGFGARANFGVRGIKILLDGVPQTMPDGQSQLTNLDLSQVGRVEVLRGAASSAYGNAAGGVIAFSSTGAPPEGGTIDAGIERGSFGTLRVQSSVAFNLGSLSLVGGGSRTASDGFREHSRSEQWRQRYALGWRVSDATTLSLRGAWGEDPRADNPGALTLTEATARPSAAAPNNLLREAGKAVTQSQLAFGLDHEKGPWSAELRTWAMTRSIDNPLAAPAPPPTTVNEGLWIGLSRRGAGLRASATRTLDGDVRVTSGMDLQSSRDDRVNRRHLEGTPFGAALVDQRESVRELGFFSQAIVPRGPWLLRGGLRWDQVRFQVIDALGTGSGSRAMSAISGHASVARQVGQTTAWAGLATAFETPTTTELGNQPDGSTGLNHVLQPQQSVTLEGGVRTTLGVGHGELVGWTTTTLDAITPFQEVGGRSYFTNAGRTRTRGVEAALTVRLTDRIDALGTMTVTDATFRDYLLAGTQLRGRRVAGIPRTVASLGIRGTIGAAGFDLDHSFRTLQYADDANLRSVAGWGAGVTGLRVQWRSAGRPLVAPFIALQNLFNRQVIGSVTVNGGFGRVAEPSAGRTISVGGTVRLMN